MPRPLIVRPQHAGVLALALGLGACSARKGSSADDGGIGIDGPAAFHDSKQSRCDDLDGIPGEVSIAARRLDLYVQLDVMSCDVLDEDVLARLRGPVRERLEEQFSKAPVSSPCGECGIALHLEVDRVGVCTPVVRKADFVCDRRPEPGDCRPGTGTGTVQCKRGVPEPTAGMSEVKRHVLWGDEFVGKPGLGYSGLTSGDRIIVSLGSAYRNPRLDEERLVQLEAAVLMHELGHSLGLTHGHPSCSRDEVETGGCAFLPNHLSVMSEHWMATGVGYGDRGGWPRDYVPTFQGFDTAPLLERSDQRVEVTPWSGRCPGPFRAPETQSWVRFLPKATPRLVTQVLRGADEPAKDMDFNGDERVGGLLWRTKDDREAGIPNEWHWVLEHRGLPALNARLRGVSGRFSCWAPEAFANVWGSKAVRGVAADHLDPESEIPDEPLVQDLIDQLLAASPEPEITEEP